MNTNIALTFIRDIDNKKKDDRVIITKIPDSDDFDLSITYSGVAYGSDIKRSFNQSVSSPSLRTYIHSILVLTMHDVDPYVRIQIDMPNAPSILLKISEHTCRRVYEAIDELIEISVTSWPRAV